MPYRQPSSALRSSILQAAKQLMSQRNTAPAPTPAAAPPTSREGFQGLAAANLRTAPTVTPPQTEGPGAAPITAPAPAPEIPPIPSVANVTPGAIERRLGFIPPSIQAAGFTGAAQGPTAFARNAFVEHGPSGIQREQVRNPLAAISEALRQRDNRKSKERL